MISVLRFFADRAPRFSYVDMERGELVVGERIALQDGLEVPAKYREEIEYQFRRFGLTPPKLRYV